MPDQEMSPPEDEQLLDLAVAIADGTPINWATASPTDSAAEASSVVMRLQCLERLVRGHEAMRSPSSERSAVARETVLTEARRKANDNLDQPFRLQWGPLIVLEKIGRGSFGDVYRAWDPRLDREVALKLIPENASDTASPVVEEGRLLARVRHPNVLTVHGAERIDGRVGIWTEYVRGETLAAEIARRGPVSAVEAARIGIEICRALAAVHGAGLLHRDVKAQNILRDSTGRIVLGDFGTGIEIDEHAGITEPQIAGTPLYLAPEIFEHRPATVGSDLYSVGVLLYFLVTGNYPVRGRTSAEIREAHATGERLPLRTTRVGLPEQFVEVVEALLKPEPEGRFQTATAVEAALAESMRGDDESHGSGPAGRRRWLPILTMAALIALIASAVLGLAFSQRQSRAEARAATTHQPTDAPVVVQPPPPPPLTPAETAPPPVTTQLNAGDWILVASFDNQTGEAILDGTIEAALKRELEYSEYVRVAQRDRWEDVLRVLGRPLDTPLDASLAREVCLRDGLIRALITGRVEKTQSRYVVTFTILNPVSGTPLATFTEDAPGQAQLLLSVRRQALRLRGALGETNAALERSRKELELAPIPALKALSLHTKALVQGSVRDSLTTVQSHERWAGVEGLVRDALREDPSFAHAWIMLAWALRNQNRPQEDYFPYARRAFDLSESATPQERYFILGSFHDLKVFSDPNSGNTDNPRELEQAISAYEALFTLQPDHYYVLGNLQRAYIVLHKDHERALMQIRLAEARPANVRLNDAAALSLLSEGNLAAARRYAARAEAALSPDADVRNAGEWSETQLLRAYMDWLEEKPGEALARASRLDAALDRAPDGIQRTFTPRLIALYLALGRLKAAQELAERRRVWEGTWPPYLLAYPLRERGDLNGLREYLTTKWTHDHPSGATAVGWRMEFLLPTGLLDEAERDIERYKGQIPAAALDTSFYPLLTGELELGRGHPGEAARLLRPWLANKPLSDFQWPAQKLADAWDAVGETPKAIEVLEKAVERPPKLMPANPMLIHHMWLASHAQLARLYRKNGDEAKARVIEERLLKLLAVADTDHPLLKELRARH